MNTLRQLLALVLHIVASRAEMLYDAAMIVLMALVLFTILYIMVFEMLLLGPQG